MKKIPITILAAVALTAIGQARAGAPPQASTRFALPGKALSVQNIQVGEKDVDFIVVNISDHPITAWAVEMREEHQEQGAWMAHDFYISTIWDEDDSQPSQGHRSGLLMPGQYHRHAFSRFGLEAPETVSIEVKTVVFEDTSWVGDPESAASFFQQRRKNRVELETELRRLEGLRQHSEPRAAMKEMKEFLESQIGRSQPGQMGFKRPGEGFAGQTLDLLDGALRSVESGETPSAALDFIIDVMSRQFQAAKLHSQNRFAIPREGK